MIWLAGLIVASSGSLLLIINGLRKAPEAFEDENGLHILPHGGAAPAFCEKANRPPATVGRAIKEQATAGTPRFLILTNQTNAQHSLVTETECCAFLNWFGSRSRSHLPRSSIPNSASLPAAFNRTSSSIFNRPY